MIAYLLGVDGGGTGTRVLLATRDWFDKGCRFDKRVGLTTGCPRARVAAPRHTTGFDARAQDGEQRREEGQAGHHRHDHRRYSAVAHGAQEVLREDQQ